MNIYRKMKNNIVMTIAITLSICSYPCLSASIYKCKDNSGEVTYSESSCKFNEEVTTFNNKEVTKEVELEDQSHKEISKDKQNAVISIEELQGTWWDLEEGGPFNSTWTFSKTHLIFKKYNGMIVRTKYTLSDKAITVHHEKSASSKEPWDEEYILESFDGKKLTWRWGSIYNVVYKGN